MRTPAPKGRWGGQLARMTPAKVQELRARYERGEGTQKALGAEYGLKQAQASEIIRRVAWRHVP
jgi:DNA-binding MarR family transcriptional regulator